MKTNNKTIRQGIYLVIDPSMEEQALLNKLQKALTKRIAAVQIWDNFKRGQDIKDLLRKIHSLCAAQQTPVFINNHWSYLKETGLEGIHLDFVPESLRDIRSQIKRKILVGLTCGNDIRAVRWAADNNIAYISFCAMFPSASASNCEIVSHDIIRKARQIFKGPLFLAGGIYPGNIRELKDLQYNGIAVISGIMESENPAQAIDEYRQKLNFEK